jgi:uncharacterized membrane protein
MSSTRAERDMPLLFKNTPLTQAINLSDDDSRATWLGFATGLRSMLPGALLAWTSDEAPGALTTLTAILAVGEIIGDKLPVTPNRLSSGPFIGRLAFGALSGALVASRFKQTPLQGALRGAAGAAIGSVVGSSYRALAAQGLGIPDFLAALIEDSVAFSIGLNAVGKRTVKATEVQ